MKPRSVKEAAGEYLELVIIRQLLISTLETDTVVLNRLGSFKLALDCSLAPSELPTPPI
jgi:hypothetical protein